MRFLPDRFTLTLIATVLLATFNKDKKSALGAISDDSRLAEHRIGCVLTNVRKKYWSILRT